MSGFLKYVKDSAQYKEKRIYLVESVSKLKTACYCLNLHAINTLIINYKILTGDDSDNLPGVKGLGEKKLLKLFP